MNFLKHILYLVIFFISINSNAQIRKANLDDRQEHQQGGVLTINEMQLVNKYNVSLDFKYSYDKLNWEVMKLGKNDYILVKFTADRSYFYVRLCTNSKDTNTSTCEDYRLQRQKRYLFNWENERKVYSIRILKE